MLMIASCCVQGGFDTTTLSVHVAVPAVEEGTLLQLLVRDTVWAQQGLRDLVKVNPGVCDYACGSTPP